uniref:Uncharacterized protein n=1 Tax=Utricularia reniformis TaxID=192314 RepID=A0A1Y0B2Z3_9LAMI|nr:hypothetical protein AEK19_MT1598 [Utricularia reniformis]ART31780.1 hypothetical protein AEK19_MT1598 [Utricularia reniformis]
MIPLFGWIYTCHCSNEMKKSRKMSVKPPLVVTGGRIRGTESHQFNPLKGNYI